MEAESLVLGRIKSVAKFHLDLCLPMGRTGRVNIYDINDKYTAILKDIISSGDGNNDVVSLAQLFKIGQLVRGCLKGSNYNDDEKGSFKPVEVSLNPKEVNKGLLRKYVSQNCSFVGAVVTEEDHGFTIDIGVPDIECFLPRSHTKGKIHIGQLISVSPIASDSLNFEAFKTARVLTVSSLQEEIESVLSPLSSIHFGVLLPGVWLKGTVHNKVRTTLMVKFRDYLIRVNRAHYKGNIEDYVQNQEVVVCLLVVDPGTKQLTGSLLPHLLPPSCPDYESSLSCNTISIGSKVPCAIVKRVDKRTVHVQLDSENAVQGIIKKAHVPEKLKADNLKTKFSVGQKVQCRVLDHDLLENVAVATMRKKLLRLPYLCINEVSPGDKVNVEISRFTKTGVVVRVEERLIGLVPFLHLADMPVKCANEKFFSGQKMTCVVLTVDKTANKMILSAKRGLVEANCPIIGSKQMMETLAHGEFLQSFGDQLYVAFVAKICEYGLLLIGVDEMRAWLPKRETGLSEDDALEATFFQGQVLRVRIKRCHKPPKDNEPQRSRLLVSLKLKEETVLKDRKSKYQSSLSVGQIFNLTVKKVQTSGIIVNLLSPEVSNGSRTLGQAFLPFDHLTDHETNVPLLKECFSSEKPGRPLTLDGDSVRQVVMLCKAAKTVVVSAKPSLVYAAKECQQTEPDETDQSSCKSTGFIREFSELRVGSQWFATVHNHVEYGVFVNLPSAIRGLAPTRFLADSRLPPKASVADLFPVGATVIAKVVEVAPSKKRRCLVSLRMVDTYIAEEHYVNGAIQSLRSWMTEQEWISTKQNELSAYRIGDLVNFQITNSNALVAIGNATKDTRCQLTSKSNKITWVPAVVYRENAEGIECMPGGQHSAVVTFVDFTTSRLELSMSSWLLKSISRRKDGDDGDACALRVGQKVSSVTVAIRSRDLAVVAFRGHAAGRFGLVPARRTFNDVCGGNAWSLGQRNQVTLRTPFSQRNSGPELFFCTLSIYDPVTIDVDSQSVRTKGVLSLVESSAFLASVATGTELSGLRLFRIAGQVIFLQLPSSDHLVFCRAINWDRTSKAVRAFLNNPPETGTEISRTARVLSPASSDTGRGTLHSRLAEVSFLDKTCIDVDDVVCGRLLHNRRDHWIVRLPGDAVGRLHVTAMLHAKHPQPIDLNSPNSACSVIRQSQKLGADLVKNRLITCRVIDKIEQQSGQSVPSLYFVSTNLAVLNGGLQNWKIREPKFGQVTDAFVKIRCPHGLLVSITHMDDMLIPIGPTLCSRLRKAQIGFRVGDHLLVQPVRMFQNQLFGELVLEGEASELDEAQSHSSAVALIEHVANKMDQIRKREERIKQTLSSLHFVEATSSSAKRDSSGEILIQSPAGKKPHLNLSADPDQSDGTGHISEAKLRRLDTSELFDQEIVERYAEFMLPNEYDHGAPESVQQANVGDQETDVIDEPAHDDAAAAECRLRETEQRRAILAALTAAQHCLPKGIFRPNTTEEYELAVRNAPSSAACWTAYMTHILAGNDQITTLHEARTIAERGLRAIINTPDLEPGEQETQQARLLLFYLIMEAKELERCTQQKETHTLYRIGSDPVLELNDQANRVSQILSRLVNLDQAEFTRKAIETMTDIGQFERAEDLARRLIKSCPQDVDRWLSLVKVRFRAGRVAAAREAQRNAASIVRSTQLPRLLTSAARLEFEFGDVDRSLSLLREQLAAHPKQHQIYEELIKLLLLAGKKSEARSLEEKAKELLKPHEYEMISGIFQSGPDKNSDN